MKTNYICNNCGNVTSKWYGKCPECDAWNTIEEHVEKAASPVKSAGSSSGTRRKAQTLDQIDHIHEIRFSTGMNELDRVLGGGAVKGSLVLVGGAPGIGKSTLLMQLCGQLGNSCKVLYASGEESRAQLKMNKMEKAEA